MTYQLQDQEDYENLRWTRQEIKKYEAFQRARRWKLFWQRHGLAVLGLAALAVAVAAFGLLMKVN